MNMMKSTVGRGVVKASSGRTTSTKIASTKSYLESLPGVSAPFPKIFDPAGLTEKASITEVRRWRESEIMHSRVAMLAAVGYLVGEQLEDFPAFMNLDGDITGPAIFQFQQVRQGFWEPLLIVIGLAETYRVSLGWAAPKSADFNTLKEDYNMGELGFDPLGLCPTDEEELKLLQTKELNNGRLAMIAIAAFTAQELVDKTPIFEHLAVATADDVIRELDIVEKDLGLAQTPIPFPGF